MLYIPGAIPIWPGLIICANCGGVGARAIAGRIICCINGIGVVATADTCRVKLTIDEILIAQ